MIYYKEFPEQDFRILILIIHMEDYNAEFHMSILGERRILSFVQSHAPDDELRNQIRNMILPHFEENEVVNMLRDPFYDCIMGARLQYSYTE